MTPVTFLAAFCSILAATSVVQLLLADDADAVDAGTTVLVVGISLVTVGWWALESSVLPRVGPPVVGVVGLVVIVAGVRILATNWPADRDREPSAR